MNTIAAQWQKISLPNSDYYYKVLTRDTIIAWDVDSISKLYLSINQGKAWELRGEIPVNIYDYSDAVINTKLLCYHSDYKYRNFEKITMDTLQILSSRDFGKTWNTQNIIIPKRQLKSKLVFTDENTFYLNNYWINTYRKSPTDTTEISVTSWYGVSKHGISSNKPLNNTVFTLIGSGTGQSLFPNHQLYYDIPQVGHIYVSVVEDNIEGITTQFPKHYYVGYSLFSEDDGKSWAGFLGKNPLPNNSFSPIKLLNSTNINTISDPNYSWVMGSSGLVYAKIEDSVGTIVMFAEKPFIARPSCLFDPDFVKQQSGITNSPATFKDLYFADSNRAYCVNCYNYKLQDTTYPLQVYDRYKGLIKVPTPELLKKSVGIVYVDNEVVMIRVGGYKDSIYQQDLYKLNTSDIVGIKDDDPQAAQLIVIYPNPAENIVRWNIADGTAEITDMQGRQVQQAPASARQADVSGLAAGVYVLTVRTAAGAVSRTFVKE